jgi:phenylacetic acid degradation protein paaN
MSSVEMPPGEGSSMLTPRREELLRSAIAAVSTREFWTPFPEAPSRSSYGAEAPDEGRRAFTELLGEDFSLPGVEASTYVDGEQSPFGFPLGIRYPAVAPDVAVREASASLPAWRDAGPETRADVCIEILERLHGRSFELAHAGMHTTGQPFVMAFQATGPHAQDRGLEAVAAGYAATTAFPRSASWSKATSRGSVDVHKQFLAVPRGVALVIGCSTFPTWNSYPGLFASLVTGNPVVIKPHPQAVLPLALTVRVAREVLAERGLPAGIVSMVVDGPGTQHAGTLALDPAVRLIDYTGSTGFGEWLESHATQAEVYTEKAGVNCIVIDSTSDFDGMCKNIAHSLALYSGQMCTAPQVVLVPAGGVVSDQGRRSFEQVAEGITQAVSELLSDPARALNVLGAIAKPDVLQRVAELGRSDRVLLGSREVEHPDHPHARLVSPLVLEADAEDVETYGVERFGPISFVVRTSTTQESLEVVRRLGVERGALTTSVYATSDDVVADAQGAVADVGSALSINLTDDLLVNQAAAFSDFHGSGLNPAANASFVDAAFVATRFGIVQTRRMQVGDRATSG